MSSPKAGNPTSPTRQQKYVDDKHMPGLLLAMGCAIAPQTVLVLHPHKLGLVVQVGFEKKN